MSAITPPQIRDINTIVRANGTELQIEDIATAAEGQVILDEIDMSIDKIEMQVADAHLGASPNEPDWRRRAEVALKRKRRSRPRLQQRIGELRRAEKRAQAVPAGGPENSPKDGQRRAFVLAAEAMLEHELFTEIWSRAREMRPAAFPEARS